VSFRAGKEEAEEQYEEYNEILANLARSITASKDSTSQFPFISVPNFELLGRHARVYLDIASVTWAPFVSESQLVPWVDFTNKESSWYNESLSIATSEANIFKDRFLVDTDFRNRIWEGNETNHIEAETKSSGRFAPLWHISPPPTSMSPINYNVLNEPSIKSVVPTFMQTRDYIMTIAKLRSEGELWWVSNNQHDDSGANSRGDGPWTSHLTPVYERLNDANSSVVGILLSTIQWDHFLGGMFEQEEKGIELVLKNTCNQSYTFIISNSEVSDNN
jgi:hypothetical protein